MGTWEADAGLVGGGKERGKDKRERDLDVLGAVSFSLFPLYLQSQWSNLPSTPLFASLKSLLSYPVRTVF